MGKTIVILGHTGVGKTEVQRKLEQLGVERIVQYTTRPVRTGELNRDEYRFIHEDKFKSMVRCGEFVEWKSYETFQGEWFYGTLKRELVSNFKERHKSLITHPESVNMLPLDDMIIFRLHAPVDVLRERLRRRGDPDTEINRRLEDDMGMFRRVEAPVQNINYTPHKTPLSIAYEILAFVEEDSQKNQGL